MRKEIIRLRDPGQYRRQYRTSSSSPPLNRSQRWNTAYSYQQAREQSPSPRPVWGKDVALKNWRRS